jgi:hypothetical protein
MRIHMKYGVLIATCLLMAGCSWFGKEIVGSGNIASETRPLPEFHSISLSGQGKIVIYEGDTGTIKVESEDNLLPYIKTEVSGGVLRIEQNTGEVFESLKPTKPITFYVTAKNLDEIILSGTGQVEANHKIVGKSLVVNVSGAGKVDLEIAVEKLSANIAGSAEYNLKGTAEEQDIRISGAALYNAPDLNSKRVKVDISGYGKVNIDAEDSLDINLSGNGSVYYKGSPKISKEIKGNGKIEQFK